MKKSSIWYGDTASRISSNCGSIGVFHRFKIASGNRTDYEVWGSYCSDPIDFTSNFVIRKK